MLKKRLESRLIGIASLLWAGCGGASPGDMAAGGEMAAAIDSAAPPDLGPACGPVTLTGTPACDHCLAVHCCTVITSCEGDAGCSGVWDHSAVVECTANACATACHHAPAKCGGINATPQSCASCVYQNCCAEATTCGLNDACLALIYQCLDRDGSDPTTCEARFPGGTKDFESLNTCGTDHCPGCF